MPEVNEPVYTDLPVAVRLDSSGEYYEFAVILDGAWVTFAVRKKGGINDDIARVKAAADEKAAETKATPPAPTPPVPVEPAPVEPTTPVTTPAPTPPATG